MSQQHQEFIIPTNPETEQGYLGVQSRELHPTDLSKNLSSIGVARAVWGHAEIIQGLKETTPQEKIGIYSAYTVQLRSEELASVIDLGIPTSRRMSVSNVFKKAFSLFIGTDPSELKMPRTPLPRVRTERELIQLESEIGSELFGPIPASDRQEFFCLDKTTWIWHKEGTDVATGKPTSTTTRYEIHENGILKAQEGAQYSFLEGKELDNLLLATGMYYEKVAREIYKRDPQSGQKLA
ncbi:MAG: hypothetical protein ABJA64_02435 [Candidatus Saccharibacteria bacterium]